VLYALGDFVARAVAFVLVPIWTHHLAPAEFGIYEVLRFVGLLATTTGGLALGAALTRRWVDDSGPSFKRFYGSLLAFQLVVLAGLLALGELGGERLFGLAFQDISYRPFGRLVLLSALAGALQLMPMQLLLFQERSRWHVGLTLAQFGTKAAVSLALVVGADAGVAGLFWGDLAGVAVTLPVCVVLMARGARPALQGASIRWALAYSLPLVPHAVAHLLLTSADRYVLEHFHGAGPVGHYGVAYLFSSVLTVLCMSLNKAVSPFTVKACQRMEGARQRGDPGSAATERVLLARSSTLFLSAVAVLALGAHLLGPEVLRVAMDPRYAPGGALIPWVVWGAALHAAYLLPVNVLFYLKRTVLIPVVSGGAALANLALNLIFVPEGGATAAAVTTLASYGLLLVGTWVAASLRLPPPVQLRRLATLLAGVALLAAGGWAAEGLPLAGRLAAKVLALVAAIPLLLVVVRPAEVRELMRRRAE